MISLMKRLLMGIGGHWSKGGYKKYQTSDIICVCKWISVYICAYVCVGECL